MNWKEKNTGTHLPPLRLISHGRNSVKNQKTILSIECCWVSIGPTRAFCIRSNPVSISPHAAAFRTNGVCSTRTCALQEPVRSKVEQCIWHPVKCCARTFGLKLLKNNSETNQTFRVVSIRRTVPLSTSITSPKVVVCFSPRIAAGRYPSQTPDAAKRAFSLLHKS